MQRAPYEPLIGFRCVEPSGTFKTCRTQDFDYLCSNTSILREKIFHLPLNIFYPLTGVLLFACHSLLLDSYNESDHLSTFWL